MPASFSLDCVRHQKLKETIQNYSSYWVSCDPGLSGTGIAIWKGERLFSHGNFHYSGRDGWDENAHVMLSRILFDVFEPFRPRFFCYELPAFMESKGMMNRKQDITKLSIFAGMIAGLAVAQDVPMGNIYPVPIIDWKGTVEKKLMNERTLKAMRRVNIPAIPKTTHEIDAIGIGLYMLGITQ